MREIHIQDLIEKKPFDALTAAERKHVLAEMSAEEYQQLYLTLGNAQSTLQGEKLSPSPAVLSHLQNQLPKRNKHLFSFGVPLWFVLLSWGVLGALFFYLYSHKKAEKPQNPAIEQVFVYQTDTIYMEKDKIDIPPKKAITPMPIAGKPSVTPVRQSEMDITPNPYLMEQSLTYFDTSLIQKTMNQAIEHRAEVENVEVLVR